MTLFGKKDEKSAKKKVEIEPRITFEGRSKWSFIDKTMYALVVIFFLAQLGIAASLVFGQNVQFQPANNAACSGDYEPFNVYGQASTTRICISPKLHAKKTKCEDRIYSALTPGQRELKIKEATQTHAREPTLWDMFGQHFEVPLTVAAIVLSFIGISALALWKIPLVAAWFSIVFLALSLITLGFHSKFHKIDDATPWDNEVLGFPIAWGVGILVVAVLFRHRVAKAAEMMSLATNALVHRPHVIGAAIILWSVITLFVFFILIAVAAPIRIWKVNEAGCYLEPVTSKFRHAQILVLLFGLVQPLLNNSLMVVCAAGVGEWYFPDEGQKYPGFTGLLWAATLSVPANAATCILISAVDSLKFIAEDWMWRITMFPLYLLWLCLKKILNIFSRYMLISWTFHGGNVFGATKRSWKVLHKHLGKLLSTHMISDFFLSYGATTFSKIVAFFAWMWLDRVLAAGGGEAPITMGRTTVHQVYVFLMMISYTIALRFPLVTIFFIGTCGSWITNNTAMAYLGGMFLGAITCLVLNAAAQIVLSSTDTIFYCFALEQHAGKTTEGRDDVYRLILDCKKEAGETNEKNDAPASGEANENANGTEMAAVTEPISEGTDVV